MSGLSGIRSTAMVPWCLCPQNPILPKNGPQSKSSDAGNSHMPKRSCKGLSQSEKGTVLNLTRKENNYTLRLLRSTVSTNLLSMKLWERKKKLMLFFFLVIPQTVEVMAPVHKCLVQMGKVLNIYNILRERPWLLQYIAIVFLFY